MDKPVKKTNELILMRRRKFAIRRNILISVLLFGILVTLCLKLSVFNIAIINVSNNKNVPAETIEQLSGIFKGNNIFYINNRKVKANITSNPYIQEVKLIRKLPATITLEVKERDATYYIMNSDRYVIVDGKGIILEVRSNIDKMDLVKLDGVKIESVEVGKLIGADETRKVEILTQLSNLINSNISGIKLDRIDLSNISDIQIYSSQLCFKIGDSFDLKSKLNKALNIALKNDIRGKKGYIDVSFEGNPVLNVQ